MDVIRRTHRAKSVVKLLSSQLDTDRVDYLLRDSLMTGAGYGRFDLEWLIHVLRIGTCRDDVEVGLDLDKGLSIAEDFVMARYYMYKHVYLHKSTRSAELIVANILARAVELKEQGRLEMDPDLAARPGQTVQTDRDRCDPPLSEIDRSHPLALLLPVATS